MFYSFDLYDFILEAPTYVNIDIGW